MIALTSGEPAGIGPDLCIQLAAEGGLDDVIVLGDPDVLAQRAERLGLPLRIRETSVDDRAPLARGELRVCPSACAEPVIPGQPATGNAQYVLDLLRQAVRGCLDGRYTAMVTAPLHKGIINDAGVSFTGHTEFLQHLTGVPRVVMLLASDAMRVALVTTHLPLSQVPRAISAARLESVIRVLDRDLRERFGLASPRILVAGLNPHAGEGGHLGREEIDTIIPTLERLRAQGFTLIGPLPADTLFTPAQLSRGDVVLAMYHDQGLPVLKYQSFGHAANITLGLPLIRTSVDHGTAFDLAGSGRADPGSLRFAIDQARRMAQRGAAGPERSASPESGGGGFDVS